MGLETTPGYVAGVTVRGGLNALQCLALPARVRARNTMRSADVAAELETINPQYRKSVRSAAAAENLLPSAESVKVSETSPSLAKSVTAQVGTNSDFGG